MNQKNSNSLPRSHVILRGLVRLGFLVAALSVFALAPRVFADPTNCISPPLGIVAWWPAEGDAKDVVGPYNSVLVGGTTFGSGKDGQAFSFDGISNSVTNAVPGLTNILNTYTMEFWAWPTAGRVSTPEDTSGIYGDSNQRYAIFPNNGKFGAVGSGVSLGTNGVSVFELGSAYLPALLVYDAVITNWTHVAVVYSNQQPKLYLNGALVRTGLVSSRSSYPSTCFGDAANLGFGFYAGLLDEVSIYNRALTAAEIAGIFNAGSAGKCPPPVPPFIVTQPTNQTVYVGDTAVFSVNAGGSKPLSYQWSFFGSPLPNATSATLVLPNVQFSQAGTYSVQVTNAYGSTNSTDAILTVLTRPPDCADRPPGMIAWWQGEGNGRDSVGTNNGNVLNGLTFTNGEVHQAFWLDGVDDIMVVSNSPELNFTNGANFSIEGWVQAFPHSTFDDIYVMVDKRLNQGVGYSFALVGGNVHCRLDTTGGSLVVTTSGPDIRDGLFHHVALTIARNSVTGCNFYVDAALVGTYDTTSIPGDLSSPAPLYLGQNSGFPAVNTSFLGALDDFSLYGRALTAAEISNIVYYGHSGKCLIPPFVVLQPTNQTVAAGNNAEFSVWAGGSEPLSYQWSFNSNSIPNATSNPLDLPNVQPNQAGKYSVYISNPVGSTNSTNAILTVLPAPPCVAPPTNLISWWRGESNAVDTVSGNNGTLSGGAGYGPGRAGAGFLMNGTGAVVQITNAPNLQIQDLTIEAWIRRGSTTATSLDGNGNGVIFGYDSGGYGVYLDPSGHPALSKIQVSSVTSGASISDTNLHHLAVTKSNSTVIFYIDGIAYPAAAYNPGFIFTTPAYIGGLANSYNFLGMIDEVSVYNRALSAGEIQAIYNAAVSGKCDLPISPFFVAQPANQTGIVGNSVTIRAVAGGSIPLSYQWYFNGGTIAGATTSTLTLNNLQMSQAGNYSVTITNIAGAAASTNALLTVVFPAATVRIVSTNVPSGSIVTVPIRLAANGNENAIAFSLNFDQTRLTYAGVSVGSGAPGGFLIPNMTTTNLGRLGLSVALPYGKTFSPGTQEVARISFASSVFFTPGQFVIPVSFGDQPTLRQLFDTQINTLAANYANGTVTISAATGYEGDVFPRPNGDTNVTLPDWLIMGRYVARLDYPTNAAQFQRADCAPRATLGDGAIKVTDWVQVDRYVSGLDPLTPVGGPTNEIAAPGAGLSTNRILSAGGLTLVPGQSGTISIRLYALGNENALSFTLWFDPRSVSLTGVQPGIDTASTTVLVNTNWAGSGYLGCAMATGTGNSFAAGDRELLRVSFVGLFGSGNFMPMFIDSPVPTEVSDAGANALPVGHMSGSIIVNANLSLNIGLAGTNVVLAWPLWASNFTVQEASGTLAAPITWSNLPNVPFNSNGESTVVLPWNRTNKFYRLRHQ
jgi:Concanavalin A-like lectin/glucanases superfamily/Immunoglobulin domain